MSKSSYVYAELAGIRMTVRHLELQGDPALEPVLTYLKNRIVELQNADS